MKRKQKDYVMHSFRGFNDSHDNVRSNVSMMDKLPTINKVFLHVVQHERQIQNHNNLFNDVNTGSINAAMGKSQASCTYCGKDNHTKENCNRKHGFPQNYKSGRANSQGRGN
ncbi:hypothetical protein Fmac_005340 [Flemingia macrophylla]|uniref:CCHC-type domain-containing protein n=1 Tax=Flemingia macrophylla TaxID=520843 RepID=A0ABD1N7G9_9FABA